MKEFLSIIEKETKGKCFRSQKYSIDTEKISTLDFKEEKEIIVEKSGETEKQSGYIDLTKLASLTKTYSVSFVASSNTYIILEEIGTLRDFPDLVSTSSIYPYSNSTLDHLLCCVYS